jgi:enoyl-CoA hydratase/carnithine racemase
MDVHTDLDTDEFGRLMEMILAAQDFGLDKAEACVVAEEALARAHPTSESLDGVAAALAERLMEKVRGQVRSPSAW